MFRYSTVVVGLGLVLLLAVPVGATPMDDGIRLLQAGQPAQAIAFFDRALQDSPGLSEAYKRRGDALYNMSDFRRAVVDYAAYVRLVPQDAEGWRARGDTWYRLRLFDAAARDYGEALNRAPGDGTLVRSHADALLQAGDTDAALAQYDRAPLDAGLLNNRGLAHSNRQQYEAALQDFNESLRLNDRSPAVWFNRAETWQKMGEPVRAAQDYSHAVELSPRDAEAWNRRGLAFQAAGNRQEALASFSQALRLSPGSFEFRLNQSNALDDLGRSEEALKQYDGLLREQPGSVGAAYNRGVAYQRRGEYEPALADFTRGSEDTDACYHRAQCQVLLNHDEAASTEAETYLARRGWKDTASPTAVLLAWLGHSQANHAGAVAVLLEHAEERLDSTAWPFPLVRYLRREITRDEVQLDGVSASVWLGTIEAQGGRREQAVSLLNDARDKAPPTSFERALAEMELHHLQTGP